MGKKNKSLSSQEPVAGLAGHAAEHRVIKHDLFRILVLNLVYLAGLLALYFTNLRSHYLDRWIEKMVRF